MKNASLSNNSLKTEVISFAIFYLLVCIFILAYSPLVLRYVGHDISPVIDGAWRIENHQVPHKDFSSILGYGYLFQQYVFLQIFHYDFIAFAVSSITISTAVFIIFLSFYSSETFIKNTTLPLRIYLFLLLVSLGLGQYHFGVGHTLITYANLYNRYCFLCLLVLFIQLVLFKYDDDINGRLFIRLIVAALLISYLFFVKLTYALAAFGFLTMCLFTQVVSLKIYWRLLLICLAVFILMLVFTNFNLTAFIKDYQTISSVRKGVLIDPLFIKYKVVQYYNILYLVSLALLLIEMIRKKVPLKFILLIVIVSVFAILLQFTNWGSTDIVMLSFVPVIFILLPKSTKLLSYKIFVAVSCFFIIKNLHSIYYLSKAKSIPYTELKNPYVSRFYTDFIEYGCDENYAERVMSGVNLINKNKTTNDKVLSFSFDNPFPLLTHTIPPKDVLTVWQFATTYSYRIYPDAKKLFNDVTLVIIPNCIKSEAVYQMRQLYHKSLNEFYTQVDKNEYWTLYRKTKPL